jgi:hypothetical protein
MLKSTTYHIVVTTVLINFYTKTTNKNSTNPPYYLEPMESAIMFDVISIVIAAITVIASIIGVLLGVIALRKPHITFSLEKIEMSLFNKEGEEENFSILTATVSNKKKFYLGDTAKNITACVLYRAPANDESMGLNFSNGLPWLETFTLKNEIPEKLTTQSDAIKALELHFFERKETILPQGRATGLAVAYGIESTNKIFLATKPPVEIPLPSQTIPKADLTACFLRLEVAGENVASTQSEGTVIMAKNWKEWSIPSKVEALNTPSVFKNILLRLGIGKRQKVIEVKTKKN